MNKLLLLLSILFIIGSCGESSTLTPDPEEEEEQSTPTIDLEPTTDITEENYFFTDTGM